MSYQEYFQNFEKAILGEIMGVDLINCVVSSNLSFYKTFRILPLLSIKEDKGTGVVTSVPAEAPDDFVALQDVKTNKAFCAKYNIDMKDLESVEPVSPDRKVLVLYLHDWLICGVHYITTF